jgi:hypothetical protein
MICPSGGQRAYFVCFSYYQLVMLFIITVCLTMGLANSRPWERLHPSILLGLVGLRLRFPGVCQFHIGASFTSVGGHSKMYEGER